MTLSAEAHSPRRSAEFWLVGLIVSIGALPLFLYARAPDFLHDDVFYADAASVMIATAGIALLGALIVRIVIARFQDRRLALARLRMFFAALVIGLAVQGWWMRRPPAPLEWPTAGYPRPYLEQLKVKDGNNPERGMATWRDIPLRVAHNAFEHSVMVARLLAGRRLIPDLAALGAARGLDGVGRFPVAHAHGRAPAVVERTHAGAARIPPTAIPAGRGHPGNRTRGDGLAAPTRNRARERRRPFDVERGVGRCGRRPLDRDAHRHRSRSDGATRPDGVPLRRTTRRVVSAELLLAV
jgi:hypothetical protein